jgi:acetyltransferase-like isoleucine patch superfamily enzyme
MIDRCLKGRFIIAEDVQCEDGTEIHDMTVIKHSAIGKDNKIWNYVNIYNSTIGDDNTIGSFVEIGGAKIGSHNKIEAFVYIPKGVTIGDQCFIGPKVSFANDKYPKNTVGNWEWTVGEVKVGNNVSIGIASIILPNVTIGEHTFIAAGSLVTSDIPPHSFAMGRPAHVVSMQVMKELGIL